MSWLSLSRLVPWAGSPQHGSQSGNGGHEDAHLLGGCGVVVSKTVCHAAEQARVVLCRFDKSGAIEGGELWMKLAGRGCGWVTARAGASVGRVMLRPGLPSVRIRNSAVDIIATNGCSTPISGSDSAAVLDCGMGLSTTGWCSRSRLDKLYDMCYDIKLRAPERREQVSLVGFPRSGVARGGDANGK